MLTHDKIWAAIDGLAERYNMSASGLARRAGLDATSFNKSKRTSPEGRDRWPSTESISKILRATGASLDEFMKLLEPNVEDRLSRRYVSLVNMAQAEAGKHFDEKGMPVVSYFDEVEFPDFANEKVFIIELSGDSMLPLYRDGDLLLVSPTANVRKGDRVVVRTNEGEVILREFRRRTAKTLELAPITPGQEDRFLNVADMTWMAKVMWVKQ